VTKRRERNPNRPATEPVLAGLPEAQIKDRNDGGKAWELVRIAYESHFELASHYSSVMFQARIAITTVMVLAVALGFGYLPSGGSNSIEFAGVPARGLVAYVAALLINLLHAMEVTYMVRFYRLVASGRRIEREHDAPSYFAGYQRADSWPLYLAYLGGILLLVALFLGAAWTPRQGFTRSAALLVIGLLPVAVFIRSYAGLVRSGRSLLKPS
jgi:hypothetical protein